MNTGIIVMELMLNSPQFHSSDNNLKTHNFHTLFPESFPDAFLL